MCIFLNHTYTFLFFYFLSNIFLEYKVELRKHTFYFLQKIFKIALFLVNI